MTTHPMRLLDQIDALRRDAANHFDAATDLTFHAGRFIPRPGDYTRAARIHRQIADLLDQAANYTDET